MLFYLLAMVLAFALGIKLRSKSASKARAASQILEALNEQGLTAEDISVADLVELSSSGTVNNIYGAYHDCMTAPGATPNDQQRCCEGNGGKTTSTWMGGLTCKG